MELTSPKTIKELLAKYKGRASKGLGQNFLIDKNILQKIIASANLKPTDTVLEVGPGIGTLTRELAEKTAKVLAIEKDAAMIKILDETLADYKNVEIINDDILKIKNYKVKNYKIVANIPYYLTSPLIRKFLETENPPQEIILMVQKEVAQRICAKPPRMSLLAVSVQFYAKPEIISYVSKNCFLPAPKVDSAIIKITPLSHIVDDRQQYEKGAELFFKIVKAGFCQPRKQLAGNLSKMLKLNKADVDSWLLKNNIKPAQRAETLSVDDWKNLSNSYGDTNL